MPSQVEIANMALSHIGVRQRIATLTEESEEARQCNLNFDQAVRMALEKVKPPFATKRMLLDLIEEEPNTEWLFRYAMPVDCVEPIYIEGAARNLPIEDRPKWALESDAVTDVTTLMTDEQDPILKYISSSVSAGRFPAFFVHAVSWVLADIICIPLTVKSDMAQLAAVGAERALNRAHAHALNQGQSDDELDSEIVRARS